MSQADNTPTRPLATLVKYCVDILKPESGFYSLAVVYGVAISILSVATPVSVQMLINSIAATGAATPLVVLSVALLALLLFAASLSALRIYLMDVFGRRFYARMVADIALRTLYSRYPNFDARGKSALFNRYFDTMVVMRRVPDILIGGFTILLQAAAGFILVSFYHPLFLLFSLVLIGLIWLVWIIWGRRAILSAVELSHRKHATAAWLEQLARGSGFYRSAEQVNAALDETERMTASYIEQHCYHFRQHFSQSLSFLLLYATASAALLGLGGWLVIQEQLSLGQLVAAELVLSTVLMGVSQLGIYMSYVYDVFAAIDELSLFRQEDQYLPRRDPRILEGPGDLEFLNLRAETIGAVLNLETRIPAGARVCTVSEGTAVETLFLNVLSGLRTPDAGYFTVAGHDVRDLEPAEVRLAIEVLDRPQVLDTTIREFLRLSGGEDADMLEAMRITGLSDTVRELPDALDTKLVHSGNPLSATDTLRLSLTAALLEHPKVLVLGRLCDALAGARMGELLDKLKQAGVTVICITDRPDFFEFDLYLRLGAERQCLFTDREELLSLSPDMAAREAAR